MPEWRVRIEIDVEGETPLEAAQEAYSLLRYPDCLPWHVEVFPFGDDSGKPVEIDLAELEDSTVS